MEISFETKSLRTLCEDNKIARRNLGKNVSEKLKSRLADIVSARNFTEIPVGNPRIQKVGRKEVLVVDLGEEISIYLTPNHNDNPLKEPGKVDWLRVTRVKIVTIK